MVSPSGNEARRKVSALVEPAAVSTVSAPVVAAAGTTASMRPVPSGMAVTSAPPGKCTVALVAAPKSPSSSTVSPAAAMGGSIAASTIGGGARIDRGHKAVAGRRRLAGVADAVAVAVGLVRVGVVDAIVLFVGNAVLVAVGGLRRQRHRHLGHRVRAHLGDRAAEHQRLQVAAHRHANRLGDVR